MMMNIKNNKNYFHISIKYITMCFFASFNSINGLKCKLLFQLFEFLYWNTKKKLF